MGQNDLLRDSRHRNKFLYTLTNPLFYESLEDTFRPDEFYCDIVRATQVEHNRSTPLLRDGFWFHCHPVNVVLPDQGWKIHVSANVWDDRRILQKVCQVIIPRGVPFKFALDRRILATMTHKRWSRGGAGKFVTIYPRALEEFFVLLEELYEILQDEKGPYILSDRRYRDCRVLYYRYGGIAPITQMEFTGLRTPTIAMPDGTRMPDIRTPFFQLPHWVTDPFPETEEEADSNTLLGGRYRITGALAFSNTGGVYVANDERSNREVIIKEARPYTLMNGRSLDAVSLLRRESDLLKLLGGTGVAPLQLDFFESWENSFLVEERLNGVDVRSVMLAHSPLMMVTPSQEESQRYYERYQGIFLSFFDVLETVHSKGIVFGDLSANNVKVDVGTFRVRLLDFEGAYRPGIDEPIELYTPGFKRISGGTSVAPTVADDLYSLAAIMLYMMFPVAVLASLRDDLFTAILPIILRDIGWENTPLRPIIYGLATSGISIADARKLLLGPVQISTPQYLETVAECELDHTIRELGNFLVAHIDYARTSLFPVDPFAHHTNGLSLGFGAIGILCALKRCSVPFPEATGSWLQAAAQEMMRSEMAAGLLTGAAGIAWGLKILGEDDLAIRFMRKANDSSMVHKHHGLFYGVAGIGMANLYMFDTLQDQEYLDGAIELGERLRATALVDGRGVYWGDEENVHLGLGYGASGVALFFLRLFERTRRAEFLETGNRALDFDLSNSQERERGIITFPRAVGDATAVPYLEEGSAGVAKVAMRYGRWDITSSLLHDVHRKYSGFSGLLYGLSSFVDVLTDAEVMSGDPLYAAMARRPVSGLKDLYLVSAPGGLAVPGEGLFRISCDYATGVAGVMRTLYRHQFKESSDFFLDSVEAK